VKNLGGWLATVVGRACLDMLRSRKARREEPLGKHIVVIEGQQHIADVLVPEVFAGHLLSFLRDQH
jgi:hypothetical protein